MLFSNHLNRDTEARSRDSLTFSAFLAERMEVCLLKYVWPFSGHQKLKGYLCVVLILNIFSKNIQLIKLGIFNLKFENTFASRATIVFVILLLLEMSFWLLNGFNFSLSIIHSSFCLFLHYFTTIAGMHVLYRKFLTIFP